jgi:hypothetical protein
MDTDELRSQKLTRILSGEMFKALGFPRDGIISRSFSPLIWKPIHRFSEIVVGFDTKVRAEGFQRASQWILPNFVKDMDVYGSDKIPENGPLLAVSNHPGAYDALVISSNIPRDDIKIIVNIPLDFINELPTTLQHFLYAPPDPHIRLNVVRAAINHLNEGGAILLFASGGIDPEPSYMGGTEEAINRWSRSLEIFLRKVPDTKILISMISGILDPKYIKHVFTRFRKARPDKQRISEFIQTINQMLVPGKLLLTPKITFAHPISAKELLTSIDPSTVMEKIKEEGQRLLVEHNDYFSIQF